MLRFNLAVIVAAIAVGAIMIERDHQVVIDAPVVDGVSTNAVAVDRPAANVVRATAAAVCPETDAVPYSAACLDYLNITTHIGTHPQQVVSLPAPAPCPDNDRAPYSLSCIAFLKGATETGMRWRATTGPVFIPGPH